MANTVSGNATSTLQLTVDSWGRIDGANAAIDYSIWAVHYLGSAPS